MTRTQTTYRIKTTSSGTQKFNTEGAAWAAWASTYGAARLQLNNGAGWDTIQTRDA